MYFSCNVSFSSLPVFLPTILNQMGFTAINAQGLSAPPYFFSFLVTIGSTWVADRIQQRGYMIVVLSCIGGIGYILLATCKSVGLRYFGTFLSAGGVFPCIANILPWVLSNSPQAPSHHINSTDTSNQITKAPTPAAAWASSSSTSSVNAALFSAPASSRRRMGHGMLRANRSVPPSCFSTGSWHWVYGRCWCGKTRSSI